MSDAAGANAEAPLGQARRSRHLRLPGEDLSLEETLRVMDVARELRDRRETAEEMFRRGDLRSKLREKLVRTARMSGDPVTEAEIDAAIGQYFESVHTYQDPPPGLRWFLAHSWVWRRRLLACGIAIATIAGGLWFLFA